jgi:hypothetical protein
MIPGGVSLCRRVMARGSRRSACPAVPVREGASELRRLVVLRHDGVPCRVGSWLEWDHLMLMDFDPAVRAVSSQPFWLRWQDEGGRSRRHAPDFFARRQDGSAVVADVRPDDRVPERDVQTFAVTHREPTALKGLHDRIDAMIEADPRDRHRRDLAASGRRSRHDCRLPDPPHLRHPPPRRQGTSRPGFGHV